MLSLSASKKENKLTNPNKTAIAVLMDRSGSMGSIKTEAEGAVNAFVKEQREQPGECTVRLAQFDNAYEDVYKSTPIEDVKDYVLNPRGMTALTDGIGKLVADFGVELAALPEDERPGNVIVVIVTDGMENASREFTREAVNALITEQTNKYNWKFIFLAAGQDAIATGAGYGISRGSSMTFDTNNIGDTIAVASAYSTATRSGLTYEFTDEDRKRALGEA